MSYKIKNINNYLDPEIIGKHENYFLDANIWFDYLTFVIDKKPIEGNIKPYLDFFNAVVEINAIDNKKVKYKPKFVINANLLHEIIYAYMFHHAKPHYYYTKLGMPKGKLNIGNKDYRESGSSNYMAQLSLLTNRLLSFSFVIRVWTEKKQEFGGTVLADLLKGFASINHCDFNDYYYHHICNKREPPIPIVTNDGDFSFKGAEIITNNSRLLSLK